MPCHISVGSFSKQVIWAATSGSASFLIRAMSLLQKRLQRTMSLLMMTVEEGVEEGIEEDEEGDVQEDEEEDEEEAVEEDEDEDEETCWVLECTWNVSRFFDRLRLRLAIILRGKGAFIYHISNDRTFRDHTSESVHLWYRAV